MQDENYSNNSDEFEPHSSEDSESLVGILNQPEKRKTVFFSGVLGLITIGMIVYFASGWFSPADSAVKAPSGPPPAPVVIATAKVITMSPRTTLPGTVVSLRDAVIASETSGKVLSVALIGDIVAVGDSLAEIDPKNAQQMVAQRQAELKRLESLHAYHSDYFKRVGKEDNPLGIPEITIAQLRSNVETARADVASARATLTSAQNDLDRTSIKAPFAGRVVSQSIQPGEFAQVGSPIVRVVDTNNLEISARVPAALVQPIEPGVELEVTSMNTQLMVPLRALVPVGDAISRSMELRASAVDTKLLVGAPVRVSLPTAEPRQVVAIPRDAVVFRPDQQYVFVVQEGIAHRKDVELGYGEGELIEVIGDVANDSVVIVRGGERLRDGQAVAWKEETAIE